MIYTDRNIKNQRYILCTIIATALLLLPLISNAAVNQGQCKVKYGSGAHCVAVHPKTNTSCGSTEDRKESCNVPFSGPISWDCCAPKVKIPRDPSLPQINFTYKLLEPIFSNSNPIGNFTTYIQDIYKFAVWAVGIAALLMISIGGFMYVTSAGNQANAETAKRLIRDALLGLIMVLLTWILLYLINPDLVNIDLRSIQRVEVKVFAGPAGPDHRGKSGSGTDRAVPINKPPLDKTSPKDCNDPKIQASFESAAQRHSNPDLKCLLQGIASQESGCRNGLISPANAYGMMQFTDAAAKQYGAPYRITSAKDLLNRSDVSIQMAADYMMDKQKNMSRYDDTFNIGRSFNQTPGNNVTVGNHTYNASNDDLIASYNAGSGTKSGSGKIGPFAASKTCHSRDGTIPVWQCDKPDSSGKTYYDETRGYVNAVQNYQDLCNKKK